MGASKFGCDECFSLLFTLLDSMVIWNFRRKKNYIEIHWNFLGIFTLLTLSYFILLIFLYVCIYLCLYFHV